MAQSWGRFTCRQLASLYATLAGPMPSRPGEVLGGSPFVAEVELPAEIHQEPLARAGIAGGSGGRKGAHREKKHQGKEMAWETFHGDERSDSVSRGARGSGDENGDD